MRRVAVYRWKPGRAPDEAKIAVLPDAWIRKAKRPPVTRTWTAPVTSTDQRVRARLGVPREVARLCQRRRRATPRRSTRWRSIMFGFDLDEATTYNLIASEYNPRCDPAWSERELQHKIKSVAETCKRPRGYLLEVDRRPSRTTSRPHGRRRANRLGAGATGRRRSSQRQGQDEARLSTTCSRS
jgi:hypothetical protein